mmetsp:Transcript_106946/g.279285  ORF Transcript_106946/g.279285 Transcript_106946/m.279285 type:complete len:206 (+) Transcript_106946:1479-2096(+)
MSSMCTVSCFFCTGDGRADPLPPAFSLMMPWMEPKRISKLLLSKVRAFAVCEITLIVAARGSLLSRARSPKYCATLVSTLADKVLTCLPSLITATSPSYRMKKASPISPWVMMLSSLENVISVRASATFRFSLESIGANTSTFSSSPAYSSSFSFDACINMRLKFARSITHTTDLAFAFTVAARGALYISASSPKEPPASTTPTF